MATTASTRSTQPPPRGEGRGRVLAAAFNEAERLPALAESRDSALELVARGTPPHEVAAIAESDVGLASALVRAAGQLQGGGRIRSVPDAVERLGPGAVEAIMRSAPTYDMFSGNASGEAPLALRPERFRLHALAVQCAADRIAEALNYSERDELALAAVLHDIGRPVLARLHPGYAERFDRHGGTPDDRIDNERRELGIDHALVGGVLTRRWGVHARIAEAVERHHAKEAAGPASMIRLADMVVAYTEDTPVSVVAMIDSAEVCGLGEVGLRSLLYDLPQGNGSRRRSSSPCPLSSRELDVLRRLAEGKVYKQIAQELELSASTVRSHLHNVYGKVGAIDRAQAVLMATDQGWI
jgi:putative nucleotidyltransferase with HDIG domain